MILALIFSGVLLDFDACATENIFIEIKLKVNSFRICYSFLINSM